MPDENVENVESAAVPSEPAPEPSKMQLHVCTPQEWTSLLQVLSACPSGVAAQAFLWASQKAAVEVNVAK